MTNKTKYLTPEIYINYVNVESHLLSVSNSEFIKLDNAGDATGGKNGDGNENEERQEID